MKPRKRILLTIIIVTMSAMLLGCGSPTLKSDTSSSNVDNSAESLEISEEVTIELDENQGTGAL